MSRPEFLATAINGTTPVHVEGNLAGPGYFRILLWITVMITSGLGCATVRGNILVNHSYPSPPPNGSYSIWQSSFSATDSEPVTGRQGNRVYDVFKMPPATFPLGADVRTVNWEMCVSYRDNLANNPPGPLMATSYRVNFWANQKLPGQRDQPGGELFSVELPAAAVHSTFAGLSSEPFNEPCCVNFAYYHMSVDLPQPFHAAPDTSYWVSWMAFTPTFYPIYESYVTVFGGQVWQDRLDRDGNLMVRLSREGMTTVYSLEGTATPPPVVLVNHPGSGPPVSAGWSSIISNVSATDPSSFDPRAQGNRVYDVFHLSTTTFPAGADITRFNWEMNVGNGSDPAGPLLATSYRIEFWENQKPPGQKDQPGASRFSVEIPAAAVHYEFKGVSDVPAPDGSINWSFYHVSVDLPETFHAAPDTSYWVSWMAFTPTFWPTYQWYGGLSGGQVWQDRVDRDLNLVLRIDRQDRNLFWSLEGTATPPGFPGWIAGYGLTGPNAGANTDPDLDGMPNSLEYVLGGNPTVPSRAGLPTGPIIGGNFVFTFNRADLSETPDLTLAVQAGPDLVNWPTVYTIGPNTASSSPGVTITENGDAPDTITVTIPQGTARIKFVRLKVTVTP